MNVNDSLLTQMYQMMAGMSGVPQTGSTSKLDMEDPVGSFQDMMTQVHKDTADTVKPKDDSYQEKTSVQDRNDEPKETVESTKAPARKTDEEEPLQAQELAAAQVTDFAAMLRLNIQPAEEAQEATVVPTVTGEPQIIVPPEAQQQTAAPELMAEEAVQVAEQQLPVEQEQTGTKQELQPQAETVPVGEEGTPRSMERVEARPQLDQIGADKGDTQSELPEEAEVVTTQQPLFKDAEAAPVKVGERYEVNTQAQDMDAQLANVVRQAVETGQQKVEIRLTPEHLGEVTIELTKDVSGVLQVVIHATNSKAAGILGQSIDQLQNALQNLGQQVHVEVQRGQESAESQLFQQADPDGHNQQHYQEQQRQNESASGEDFLQQLRLGLFSLEEAV